ncbi:activating signal cointegrator 1 isoform X3 [Sorex araneus]|uniref:activating signal cointegrator 1 isoform X3 n=1 Tax=Sorex araneus TaxID=42254 RepID=UPI002433E8AE|nr:activating signal cointegrator 1 isoform X3 [Sorex araneus]XP_054982428.1 activating signal cointegrator 1 isoform X3 [Sorex araneus]
MAAAGAASREQLASWCTQQLRRTFGLDVSEEIVQYVLSIESPEEIREYVTDLLQGNEGKKGQFIEELITKWQKDDQELTSDNPQQSLKKDDISDGQRSGDQLKRSRKKGRNRQEFPAFAEPDASIEVKTPFDLARAQENNSLKKKTKFVSLYTKEGQDRLAVLIPGRHPCDCLGQKHKLINNCLVCGRIVCEQEGSGPCLFCGSLVCTREEQDILQRDSNKSQKLLKKLMAGTENSGKTDLSTKDLLPHQELKIKCGLEKAIKHKDKLLEFDRTSIRRTQVIDDESDYFASDSNQWLSKIERETLQKREEELREFRHASRLSKKITIDFAGRKIVESENPLAEYHSNGLTRQVPPPRKRLSTLQDQNQSPAPIGTSCGFRTRSFRKALMVAGASPCINPGLLCWSEELKGWRAEAGTLLIEDDFGLRLQPKDPPPKKSPNCRPHTACFVGKMWNFPMTIHQAVFWAVWT